MLALLLLAVPVAATSPDDMRRDFEVVQKLNTRDAYEAFLKQYPEGLYAGLAREELKKLDAKAIADLFSALNYELARVGCAPNAGSREWTSQSEAALAQFNVHARTKLDPAKIDASTLAALREKTERVCPLACGPNQRVQGDVCVAVAPPEQKQKQPPQEKKKAEQAGQRYCLAGPIIGRQCVYSSLAQCEVARTSDIRATCFPMVKR